MHAALFAIVIGLLEDVPQCTVSLMLSSECDGGLDWSLKLSITIGFLSVAWKLLSPLFLKMGLLM